jgi:hypothetical protein
MEALAFPNYYSWMAADRMCALYRRTSRDGLTFKITPVYQRADDAEIALANAPHTYSQDGQRFAPWPIGYTNVT